MGNSKPIYLYTLGNPLVVDSYYTPNHKKPPATHRQWLTAGHVMISLPLEPSTLNSLGHLRAPARQGQSWVMSPGMCTITHVYFVYVRICIYIYIKSYYVIFYYVILRYVMLYHIISYYIILYHLISSYIILYHIISYCIILYHIISYHIILYYITLHCCILYYIILYYIILLYIIYLSNCISDVLSFLYVKLFVYAHDCIVTMHVGSSY